MLDDKSLSVDFEKVIERIKEVDNDDMLYRQMLKEPALNNIDVWERWSNKLEFFLKQIIEQPLSQARKVSTTALVKNYYKPFINDKSEETPKKEKNWHRIWKN